MTDAARDRGAAMEVTETERDGLRRGYDVVIPAEEITGRRDARLAEIARTVSMPGFRPGRVPVAAVKDRYGAAVADIWSLLQARRRADPGVPMVTYVDLAAHERTELSVASVENAASRGA